MLLHPVKVFAVSQMIKWYDVMANLKEARPKTNSIGD